MSHPLRFRLEYWRDGEWFVLMMDGQSQAPISAPAETKEIEVRA
jgi:hypothetical protein